MSNNANPVRPQTCTIELNIGLRASKHATKREPFAPILPAVARFAARDRLHISTLGEFENRVERCSSEPTLVVRVRLPVELVERGILDEAVHGLAVSLEQDCIAVYHVDGPHTGTGELIGPRAAEWGEFNPEFFSRFDPTAD